MPVETSPEAPLPVRTLSRHLGEWIGRLGRVWVEGQITELNRRPGMNRVYLTLRDAAADVSVPMSVPRAVLEAVTPPIADGQQVVVHVKPEWYFNRGQLSLAVHDIRPVGAGALLARLEQLKSVLAAEGLFARERKRPLPFLPRAVGVVTGRESAARRDVEENARRRWPAVRLVVTECQVQGVGSATAVIAALQELDRDPDVDVIVVARGGGSVEDLLTFSDEALCRAVAACRTPVVSAIGHEQDTPLLDLVADVRASTPTDAGKLVVPDVAEELDRVRRARTGMWRCVSQLVERERAHLVATRSRPCLADPHAAVLHREDSVVSARDRATRALRHRVEAATADVRGLHAQLRSLSPQGTLERGYAIVQPVGSADVVRRSDEVAVGDPLRVRLASGELEVAVTATTPGETSAP